MRKPAEWMSTGADDRILEYLRETDRATPEAVASETGYTNKHVALRCQALADNDLLADAGNGFYELTGAGERYLDGDLDVAARDGA